MKNILCVNSTYYCSHCKLKGFFCYTPNGADFETCPCCGENDFLNNYVNYKNYPTRYDFLFEDEFIDDMRYKFKYCNHCNIIFQLGCVHLIGGCTESTYNCHFIKKWKDKISNIEYDGMPMFDDVDDWFNNANNVEVLEMYCPHKNNKCKEETRINLDMCNL